MVFEIQPLWGALWIEYSSFRVHSLNGQQTHIFKAWVVPYFIGPKYSSNVFITILFIIVRIVKEFVAFNLKKFNLLFKESLNCSIVDSSCTEILKCQRFLKYQTRRGYPLIKPIMDLAECEIFGGDKIFARPLSQSEY